MFTCNPAGADLLFEDYQAFHESLKASESATVVSKDDAIVGLLALTEAMVRDEDIETSATEAIRMIRFLLRQRKEMRR